MCLYRILSIIEKITLVLGLVNNNLASDVGWELTDGGFHNLIGEMFSELRDELADTDAAKYSKSNMVV